MAKFYVMHLERGDVYRVYSKLTREQINDIEGVKAISDFGEFYYMMIDPKYEAKSVKAAINELEDIKTPLE